MHVSNIKYTLVMFTHCLLTCFRNDIQQSITIKRVKYKSKAVKKINPKRPTTKSSNAISMQCNLECTF